METGEYMQPGEGWGDRSEEWARLQSLLDLARQAHLTELTPERREQIRERVLDRIERNELRRRRVRAFVAAASAALLACLALRFVFRARTT
jgi:hypothetical protein